MVQPKWCVFCVSLGQGKSSNCRVKNSSEIAGNKGIDKTVITLRQNGVSQHEKTLENIEMDCRGFRGNHSPTLATAADSRIPNLPY